MDSSPHRIVEKEQLSADVFRAKVAAPMIAAARKPGQFVMLVVCAEGERIPLTIADADPGEGTITLIWQRVGKTTSLLSDLKPGDTIAHLVGPLGQPTEIAKKGTIICVGGGIGVAPLYPITRAMKEAGNRVLGVIGARTAELIILEREMARVTDELVVVTDDGSRGEKALVTAPLKRLCEKGGIDEVIAIGPPVMMKFCAETTRPFGVKTMVSLNTIMIDGTGMCGGCRVTVGGKTKFVCVDGPEFDGHAVDFDNMIMRLSAYRSMEAEALRAHRCLIEENP